MPIHIQRRRGSRPRGGGNGSCGPRPGTALGGLVRDVNSAGYRLRVLCKPRPRAGLVGLRQTFVRRRPIVPSYEGSQAEVRYREKLLAALTSTQPRSASWPSCRKLIEAQRHQEPSRSSAVSTFSVSIEGGKRRQREPVRSTKRDCNGEIAPRCRHRFGSIRARMDLVGSGQTFVRRRQRSDLKIYLPAKNSETRFTPMLGYPGMMINAPTPFLLGRIPVRVLNSVVWANSTELAPIVTPPSAGLGPMRWPGRL